METQVDLSTYWQIVKRRKWKFILPAVVILLAAGVVSFALPSKYKSEATILVEAQSIPDEMVQTTVTGVVEERMQTINQVVLSRQNLLEIIERFNLYSQMRQSATTEEVVGKMSDHINMEPVHAEISNTESGRKGSATIAFTLSYEGDVPNKVAQVTNTLVSQYVQENSRLREQQADTTVIFLRTQKTQLKEKLEKIEDKIAEFKEKNLHALPSMTDLNMERLQRIQERIDRKRHQVHSLKDRKIYLEGQLLGLDPSKYFAGRSAVLSPQEQLKQLQNQYYSLKASYSPQHPDVQRLDRQILALEQVVNTQKSLRDSEQRLQRKESELAKLRKKFSDKYPDVVQLQKEVRELRKKYQDRKENRKSLGEVQTKPQNPSYIELQTRIETTKMELESASTEIQELRDKYQMYRQRLEKAPMVEQKHNTLQRQYNSLQQEYKEVQSKLAEAREAQELEKNRMSQKLRIIDPPAIPEQPSSPNRLALLLIGGVLATGFGVGSGSLAEYLDKSVYEAEQLATWAQKPVLASVPYMETQMDKRRKLTKRAGTVFVLLLCVGMLLFAVHTWIIPLDILWIKLQQKYSSLF